MNDDLEKSLMAVCKLFEKFNVRYILIGGAAVTLHGYYRQSINDAGELTNKPDIDVWYNPDYENYFNVLKVIEALGEDVTAFKNEQAPNPHKSFCKLDFKDFTLDLLPLFHELP